MSWSDTSKCTSSSKIPEVLASVLTYLELETKRPLDHRVLVDVPSAPFCKEDEVNEDF